MIKKNLKLLAILFIIITTICSFSYCFADETDEVTATTTSSDETTTETEEEIHEGDLYLFENDVTMDKLVDGNVYIMGKNINITGQVNGNLFVFGDSIKFDDCYIRYSVYACANNIYYNGACNDLYAVSKKIEMTYDSYVVRDVKISANSTILKAAIGRDVDLQTNSIDFGADSQVPVIYGNLRYSANQEKELSDDIVKGDITYSSSSIFSKDSIKDKVLDILLAFGLVIVTSLVIYALLNKFKPNCVDKLNYTPITLLKALGIGLLTIIAIAVISLILIITSVGAKLGLILILSLILIFLFAMPIVSILITNLLKPILKIEKSLMYYVVLALVSIVLYGLTLIPFVGFVFSIIIKALVCGIIVIAFIQTRKLSDEEIAKKLEEKEAKKALRTERKEEKLKLKETKKSNKE